MIRLMRVELLKVRTTRTTLGLVLGMVALVLLTVLLTGLLSTSGELAHKSDQRNLLGGGSLAGVFAALAGVLLMTGEFRFGTIRPTLLFTPRRGQLVAAKLAAAAVAGLAFGVVGEAVGFGVGAVVLAGRGISFSLGSGDVALLLLGTLAGVALWGAIGVGLGAIVRNQIGGVIALLAWGFVVESLLFGFVPSVGRWLPTHASDALAGLSDSHLVAPGAGAGALIAWTAALAAAALVLTRRRDVS
jgi:ABC-2 type transport system permease protein